MVKIISNVKGDHVEASVELAGNMKAIVSELVNAIGSAYLQIVHSVRNERGFAYVARGQL